jgi:predicted RNA polymerase sigma factor
VISKVRGPDEGRTAIERIRDPGVLKNYYLYYAVLGELHLALSHLNEAKENFRQALGLTGIPAEENFLRQRLHELMGKSQR